MGTSQKQRQSPRTQATPASSAPMPTEMPDNSQVQEAMRAAVDVGVVPQTAFSGGGLDLGSLNQQIAHPTAIHGTESVPDLVEQVRGRVGDQSLGHLQIYGHGNEGMQILSNHDGQGTAADGDLAYVTAQALCAEGEDESTCDPYLTQALAELGPLFDTEEGQATLHGCHTGYGKEGEALVQELAELWGVPVSAAESIQRAMPGLEGNEITCTPSEQGTTCERTEVPFGMYLPGEDVPRVH